MRYEFKLPDIGEGLTEGTISEWLAQPGDAIEEDAPLCMIETDKVAVDITAPCSGTLVSTQGEPGETLQVGTVIAVFETDKPPAGHSRTVDQTAGEPDTDAAAVAVGEAEHAQAAPSPSTTPDSASAAMLPSPSAGNVRAAPSTRRLAREHGVDLNTIKGTGPGNRILHSDVLQHAGQSPTNTTAGAPAGGQRFAIKPISSEPGQKREALTSLQKSVAEQMTRSVTLIPHASSSYRCEAERFVALRKTLQERLGTRVSFTAMVMRAMVPALQAFPYFNCSFDDTTNEIVHPPAINIGFAAHTDDGLVVPVVRNCEDKSLVEISQEVDRLATAARNRKIKVAELRGGTITLSNVGSHGQVETTGGRLIVNHPQAAIIGLSRIRPQAVVHDGVVVAAACLDIYTSYDHRIIDGIYANLFVEQLAGVIQEPGMMLAL